MLHLIITWVNSAVSSQIIWTIECLWTLGTLMRPLSCMSVDVLLETKWMAECLVAHGTFPFPATHIRAHSLNMSCKVAERSKYLATLSTSITLCEENNISLHYTSSLHIKNNAANSNLKWWQRRVWYGLTLKCYTLLHLKFCVLCKLFDKKSWFLG